MTDELNPNEIDVTEEDNDEEIDPTTIDLSDLLVNMPRRTDNGMPNEESLFYLLKAHNDHARTVNAMAEERKKGIKKDDIESEIREGWKLDILGLDKTYPVSELSEEIFTDANNPLTLIVALRQLDELRDNVKAQIDYLLMKQVAAEKVSRNITETADELYLREKATCKALFSMLGMQTDMVKLLNGGEKWQAPEGLYKADTERAMFNVVQPAKDTIKARGTSAQSRKVVYTWENEYGTDTFEGISEEELCHEYLSTPTVRISRKQLDTALKANGIKSVANEGKPWSIDLVHGTLSGKLAQ